MGEEKKPPKVEEMQRLRRPPLYEPAEQVTIGLARRGRPAPAGGEGPVGGGLLEDGRRAAVEEFKSSPAGRAWAEGLARAATPFLKEGGITAEDMERLKAEPGGLLVPGEPLVLGGMRSVVGYDRDGMIEKVKAKCDEAGSASAYAATIGMSGPMMSQVLKRHRAPPDKLLAALGLRRVTVYEVGVAETDGDE